MLYPQIDKRLSLDYQLLGRRLSIRTLDLARPWQQIHESLLGLVAEMANGEEPTATIPP